MTRKRKRARRVYGVEDRDGVLWMQMIYRAAKYAREERKRVHKAWPYRRPFRIVTFEEVTK